MKIIFSTFLVTLCIICFTSCSKKKKIVINNNDSKKTINSDTLKTQKNSEKIVVLNTRLYTQLKGIQSFDYLKQNIEKLNKQSLLITKETAPLVVEELKELNQVLPNNTRTKAVLSRLIEIETFASLLDFELNKSITDTNLVTINTRKTIVAYNHFITQLNETEIVVPNKIEEELKKEFTIKKDSIINDGPLF